MLYNVRSPEESGRESRRGRSKIRGRTRTTHVILMAFHSQSRVTLYNITKWDLIATWWMICPSEICSRAERSLIVFTSYICIIVFRNINPMPLSTGASFSHTVLCLFLLLEQNVHCFLCNDSRKSTAASHYDSMSPHPLCSHTHFDLVAEFLFPPVHWEEPQQLTRDSQNNVHLSELYVVISEQKMEN